MVLLQSDSNKGSDQLHQVTDVLEPAYFRCRKLDLERLVDREHRANVHQAVIIHIFGRKLRFSVGWSLRLHCGRLPVGSDASAGRNHRRTRPAVGDQLRLRPELTSRHFLAWALEWKIQLRHIQPGKPTRNAHVESFHGSMREESPRVSSFSNLFDARESFHLSCPMQGPEIELVVLC